LLRNHFENVNYIVKSTLLSFGFVVVEVLLEVEVAVPSTVTEDVIDVPVFNPVAEPAADPEADPEAAVASLAEPEPDFEVEVAKAALVVRLPFTVVAEIADSPGFKVASGGDDCDPELSEGFKDAPDSRGAPFSSGGVP